MALRAPSDGGQYARMRYQAIMDELGRDETRLRDDRNRAPIRFDGNVSHDTGGNFFARATADAANAYERNQAHGPIVPQEPNIWHPTDPNAAGGTNRVREVLANYARNPASREGAAQAISGGANPAMLEQLTKADLLSKPALVEPGVGVRGDDLRYRVPVPDKTKAGAGIFEERPKAGGVAQYKDGVFEKWITAPPSEGANRAAEAGRIKREDALRAMTDDMSNLDAALLEVESNPDAFGLRNYIPAVGRDLIDSPDRIDRDATTIGSLEHVVGRLRHDRFGGALTPMEAGKAARIFAEPTRNPKAIKAQLEVIKNALARQQKTLGAALDGQEAKGEKETPADDLAKAKADPKFAAWLRANGYKVP